MSINLHEAYSDTLNQAWLHNSYLKGKLNAPYSLEGVKSLTITSMISQALNDYTRSGTERFGTLTEVQDTIQTLTMRKDRAWTKSLDRGNLSDQQWVKKVADFLNLQLKQQVIPEQDKWGFRRLGFDAGYSVIQAAVSASNILGFIQTARTQMVNNGVPEDGRYLAIPSTYSNHLRNTTSFLTLDKIAQPVLTKGVIGMLYSFMVVEVPDAYFPTGLQFVCWHELAGADPKKIDMMRALDNQRGVDGWVLEGHHYYDTFVIEQQAGSVFASVLAANKTATPIITPTVASHAVTAVTGVTFKYTIDGSDPRYSATAITYASAVTLASDVTIKVAGFTDADTKAISDVAEATYTA